MADISDVTAYLANQVAAAVYPNGSGLPSVAAMDVRIFEGWPIPDQLDLDLAGKTLLAGGVPTLRGNGPMANVSIFPMLGTGIGVYQILNQTYTIKQPVITTSFVLVGNVVTVSGTLSDGEYLTLVIDDAVKCSQTGASVAAMLAALAAQAQAAGYAATSTATTLTVPFGHVMVVRQGGVGIQGRVTHRQRQSVMITVWAPTHDARTVLASAIDVVIKATNKVTMPDTSQAIVLYSRTNVIDTEESSTIYRRDLIYDVEYATLEQFAADLITSVTTTIASAVGNASANAII